MLRMSKLADYSTVIVSAIARDPDAIHSISCVDTSTAVATPAVAKVMKTLARVGVVKSLRGINGSYVLARAPQRITLAEITLPSTGQSGSPNALPCPLRPRDCMCHARKLAKGQSSHLRGAPRAIYLTSGGISKV